MSAAVAAAAAAAAVSRRNSTATSTTTSKPTTGSFYQFQVRQPIISRYETQKRRDWNNFRQYLRTHRPKLSVSRCSGSNVIEFLCYLDEFGGMKVHDDDCVNYGHVYAAESCCCPVRQPWSSLVAVIGRLRVAYEENGGSSVLNPFNAVDVRVYLNGVKVSQDKSRGIEFD